MIKQAEHNINKFWPVPFENLTEVEKALAFWRTDEQQRHSTHLKPVVQGNWQLTEAK